MLDFYPRFTLSFCGYFKLIILCGWLLCTHQDLAILGVGKCLNNCVQSHVYCPRCESTILSA